MNSSLIAVALLLAAPGPKDSKKSDPAIVGIWKVIAAVKGGKPGDVPNNTTIEFTSDGAMKFGENGQNTPSENTFKVDAKKNPVHLDVTAPGIKGGHPRLQRGIYKIEKDTLTICITYVGDRPAKFESPDGSGVILLTLERKTKD